MKRSLSIVLAVLVFLAIGFMGIRHSLATQTAVNASMAPAFVPNEVLVKFKAAAPDDAIATSINAISGLVKTHRGLIITGAEWAGIKSLANSSFIGDPRLFRIIVPPGLGAANAIAEMSANPYVEYAEGNAIYYVDVTPSDTYFSSQWALNNTGQTGGTTDADIDAPEAWNIATGSDDVTIAIIDTGITFNHPDLQNNIWTNAGEIGGGKETDGIDNDGNGEIDDWRGWDYVNSDNNPTDDYDPYYHGTHVAGIAGAEGNNSLGVSGVCWNVKLMAVKGLDENGYGDVADLINAIDYARLNGANIINASWGSYTYSASLTTAIERTMTDEILFIAAAGNDSYNTDISGYQHYPSSYDSDNVISVLSTDHNDNLSTSFSNYGLYSVDLGAPGGTGDESSKDILSTKNGSSYRLLAGTSMATPFVSGTAALLMGYRPSIDWWQNKTTLLKSADSLSALLQKCRTHGRLNAYNALTYTVPVLPDAPSDLDGTVAENGGNYEITLTWTDNSDNESGFKIYLKSGNVFQLLDTVPATLCRITSPPVITISMCARIGRMANLPRHSSRPSELINP